MPRYVIPRAPGGVFVGEQNQDAFQDRLLKYIPVELMTPYIACVAAFDQMGLSENTILKYLTLIAFVFCICISVFTKKLFGKNIPDESATAHRIASTIAFLACAYSASGAALPSYYNGSVALVLMALSALMAYLIWPESKQPTT